MVSRGNTCDRADLVFPLTWHDFSISSRALDAGVEAGSVVSISNNSAKAVAGANGAVVGALRSGVPVVGPAEWPGCELGFGSNKRVLLFNSEPRLFSSILIENILSVVSEVSVRRHEFLAGSISPLEGLRHDNDVVALSEGVSKEGHGLHDDLRVVSRSLVTRRSVVVPLGNISERRDDAFECAALGTECDAAAINPDVLGDGDALNLFPSTGIAHILVVEL